RLGVRLGVRAVIGVGVKVAWTPDDLARAAALAERPAQTFDTREQAVARHLRVSGLDGLVDPGDAALEHGIQKVEGGWRPAFGVGEPGMAALLAAAAAEPEAVPVVLARGERDPMVSTADLAALVRDPV